MPVLTQHKSISYLQPLNIRFVLHLVFVIYSAHIFVRLHNLLNTMTNTKKSMKGWLLYINMCR